LLRAQNPHLLAHGLLILDRLGVPFDGSIFFAVDAAMAGARALPGRHLVIGPV